MASANTLPIGIARALANGFFSTPDPGASGTISWSNKGLAICEVVTAAGESRALPSAAGYAVGQRCLVLFKTDGGNLTITGAETSVVLDSAGDMAEFVVTDNNGTHVWRRVADTTGNDTSNVVIRAVNAASAGLVPVSGGADKTLAAATPVDLGTVNINTGDAGTDTALIALADALAAFGLVTHTWT